MDANIRRAIYEPLLEGKLSCLIPDFTINLGIKGIVASSALLSASDSDFEFETHFLSGSLPEALESNEKRRTLTKKDQISVRGQIGAEIAFECNDVFPPMGGTTRSRGTSTVELSSSKLHIIPEGFDAMKGNQIADFIGTPIESREDSSNSFNAHVIFHGPKLKVVDAGSDTIRKNDFLGEAASSSADTHLFEGEFYEGALIQRDKELHLHLRSRKEAPDVNGGLEKLVDCVSRAASFVLGYHPWPLYYELRNDYQVVERWLSPRVNLKQTFLSPVSESLWFSARGKKEESIHRIIPIIANGMGAICDEERERLNQLLWHFRCGEFGDLSHSAQLLIICAVLEGLTKLIAGVSREERLSSKEVWKQALEKLNLSWDMWGEENFERWKERRNQVAHGWMYISNDDLLGFNDDHPKLGCAFSFMVAAYCGYRGHIVTHPFRGEVKRIADFSKS